MDKIDVPGPVCQTTLQPLEAGQESLACPQCGNILTAAYEAGMAEVRAYIRSVRLIDAIRVYRKTTGANLGIAKDAVTEMWHSGDW